MDDTTPANVETAAETHCHRTVKDGRKRRTCERRHALMMHGRQWEEEITDGRQKSSVEREKGEGFGGGNEKIGCIHSKHVIYLIFLISHTIERDIDLSPLITTDFQNNIIAYRHGRSQKHL